MKKTLTKITVKKTRYCCDQMQRAAESGVIEYMFNNKGESHLPFISGFNTNTDEEHHYDIMYCPFCRGHLGYNVGFHNNKPGSKE